LPPPPASSVGVDGRDDALGLAAALDDVGALDREAVADVLVAGEEDVAGEARLPCHERRERAVADLPLERDPLGRRRPRARPRGRLGIVALHRPRGHRDRP
jgi:hypothetical protein